MSAAPKKPALVTPTRAAVVLLVIVAIIILAMELPAKTNYEKSYGAIDSAMAKGEHVFKKDLEGKYLVGSYDRESPSDGVEEFTWTGLFTSHGMRLHYEADGFVKKIEPK